MNRIFKKHTLFFPAIILNDNRLSAVERLLLGLIIQYDQEKGCFATNDFLAQFCNCSLGTISKSIKNMQRLGYIKSNRENKERGGRGYVRRVSKELKLHRAAK